MDNPKYELIVNSNLDEFHGAVNNALSDGLELHGGTIIFQNEEGVTHYAQAVIYFPLGSK